MLAVEKRVTSTLMEPSSIEKILEIDSHIGECVGWRGSEGLGLLLGRGKGEGSWREGGGMDWREE